MKYQQATIALAGTNDTVPAKITLDKQCKKIKSISFHSPTQYPAPASIQKFEIEGDSSMFSEGTFVGHFQALDKPFLLEIEKALQGNYEVNITLKDETNASTAYKVQVLFELE